MTRSQQPAKTQKPQSYGCRGPNPVNHLSELGSRLFTEPPVRSRPTDNRIWPCETRSGQTGWANLNSWPTEMWDNEWAAFRGYVCDNWQRSKLRPEDRVCTKAVSGPSPSALVTAQTSFTFNNSLSTRITFRSSLYLCLLQPLAPVSDIIDLCNQHLIFAA